jgi:hypothetical protein
MKDKLYLVTCRGMQYSADGVKHGIAYVVAKDSYEAYKKVRKHLDSRNLGFAKERELKAVELLAEDSDYADCQIKLFL